jgi:hypothetical protein
MSFDLCNCPLKIWESIKIPISKVGAHLGVCGFIPSHFPTLPGTWNVIFKLHSWLAPLQALALVVSPKLGLWQTRFWYTFKKLNFDRLLPKMDKGQGCD